MNMLKTLQIRNVLHMINNYPYSDNDNSFYCNKCDALYFGFIRYALGMPGSAPYTWTLPTHLMLCSQTGPMRGAQG